MLRRSGAAEAALEPWLALGPPRPAGSAADAPGRRALPTLRRRPQPVLGLAAMEHSKGVMRYSPYSQCMIPRAI